MTEPAFTQQAGAIRAEITELTSPEQVNHPLESVLAERRRTWHEGQRSAV